jgi:hypothetical protein
MVPLGQTYADVVDVPPKIDTIKKIIRPSTPPFHLPKEKEYLLTYFFKQEKSYLLIEKNQTYFYIKNVCYTAPLCLYSSEKLLIEGDITNDGLFLLSDILNVCNMNFTERLKRLNALLREAYYYDPIIDPFRLQVTDYVAPQYIEHFTVDYAAPYKSELKGWLILTNYRNPEYVVLPLEYNFNFPKVKSVIDLPLILNPLCDTVIFQVRPTNLPDVYHLYLRANQYYDLACIPDKSTSAFVKETIGMLTCYLCRFNFTFRRWQPFSVHLCSEPDDYEKLKN